MGKVGNVGCCLLDIYLVCWFGRLLSSGFRQLLRGLMHRRVRLSLNNFPKPLPPILIKTSWSHFAFYGLALYLNNVSYYVVKKDGLIRIEEDAIVLKDNQWLAAVGRLRALAVRAPGLSVHVNEGQLQIDNPDILKRPDTKISVADKPDLFTIAPELDQVRYAQLWLPFALLARAFEGSMVAIHNYITSSWGMTVVIFAVLLKIVLIPVSIMVSRMQSEVSKTQALLEPKLAHIKANYDGEDAHNRLMAAHKELGVSPFYPLKSMLGIFIQIPIWIAIFNALGEMPQFAGQSFLWVNDLAYPDAIASLGFSVPLLGSTINLMPIIMTAVTILSTYTFQDSYASDAEIGRQKFKLYLMAAAFFILFFPFPAVMVFYWTLASFLQTLQRYF